MKRLIFALPTALLWVSAYAQSSDPVAITIDGRDIPRSEFQRAYDRNKETGTSVADYAQLYINYRLKIAEAKKLGIDTTQAYRKEFGAYRDDALLKYVSDPQYEDSVVRAIYARIKEQLKDSDILNVSHILFIVPQKASEAQKNAVKAKADSVYALLKAGADFAETAKKYSQDFSSARQGGKLPEFGPGATLKEFEEKCYSLKPGQMSEPFASTAGYHIVLLNSRSKLPPYESKKAELIKVLNAQGLQQMVFAHTVDKMLKSAKPGTTRDQLLDSIVKAHATDDAETANLVQDYREGLLAYDVTKQEVWDKAEKDTVGLENFFKKNKKKYRWDAPRFKGFVIQAKNEADIAPAAKLLRQNARGDWRGELKKQFRKDGKPQVMAVRGVWKQGENPLVDKYAFKDGNAKAYESKQYPYATTDGKMLKGGPEEVSDVKAQATSDYQDYKEKEWIKRLRAASKITVHDDVLKTVESH